MEPPKTNGFNEQEYVLKLLGRCPDILQHGHFVGKSGRHLDCYFDKSRLFQPEHDALCTDLCRMLWLPLGMATTPIAVIGPQTGGAKIAERVRDTMLRWREQTRQGERQHLTEDIVALAAEKIDAKNFHIPEKQRALIKGRRAIVVEDVLNSGDSAAKTLALTVEAEPSCVQLAAFVNRGGLTAATFNLPPGDFRVLVSLPMPSWSDEECLATGPCSRLEGIREDLGHGREWRDRNPEHPLGRWNAP